MDLRTCKKPLFIISGFWLILLGLPDIHAQSSHQHIRKGNRFYNEQQFDKAEEEYRRAMEKDPSVKSRFNLGNTLYHQQRFEEAIQNYDAAALKVEPNDKAADVWYNRGNAHLSAGEYKESIQAYKNTLNHRPGDLDAINNLFIARMMKQQQEQQQNQQKQQQDRNDQDEEDGDSDTSNQDIKSEEEEEESQAQWDEEDMDHTDENTDKEKTELSKEEADRLLRAVENEEKKVQEKLRKGQGSKPKSRKDW
ncbi:MAG TPA: tetratricopeptide repeat protein [Saprospiraceae bacterium]|nr:tetratricopeptide repeat protein [Saprospiraceae bacterium]